MDRSEWIGLGASIVISGIGYLVGGPIAALLCVVVGFAIIGYHAFSRRGEVDLAPESTLFGGPIPLPPEPPRRERPWIVVSDTSAEHDQDHHTTHLHLKINNASDIAAMVEVAYSTTFNGIPANLVRENMPQRAILIAPRGEIMLNLHLRGSAEQDAAIWDGTGRLEVTAVLSYEGGEYTFIGRFDLRTLKLLVLASEHGDR